MKIKIYQINMDRDVNRICFMSWGWLRSHGGYAGWCDPRGVIGKEPYDMVWEGESDTDDLDRIFTRFNTQLPEDFHGRSLSCSDIVETPAGLFFCDSVGWVPVRWRLD